jgi:hypothetical protein
MRKDNPDTFVKRRRAEFQSYFPALDHTTSGIHSGKYNSEITLKAYRLFCIRGLIAVETYLKEVNNA